MTCPYVISDDTTQYCTLNCDHGDEIDRLRASLAVAQAVIAEVRAALDQYDAWPDDAIPSKAATACVSAIAKAVRR